MKNWKKGLSALVVAAMAMSLVAGCGGKGDNGGSSNDSNSESSSSGSETVIKIGGIGPTTGGAAIYGEAVKNGAELAVKEINEAGGINGIQVLM